MIMAAAFAVWGLHPATANEQLYPIAQGNAWEYKAGQNTSRVKVVRREGEVWVLEHTLRGKTIFTEYLKVSRDGVRITKWVTAKGEVEFQPPVLAMKFNAKEGDSWTTASEIAAGSLEYAVEVLGEEEIEVQAGKYTAIKVRATMTEQNATTVIVQWYAPGVGMVKEETEADIQGKKSEFSKELSKFTPARGGDRTEGGVRCPKCGVEAKPGKKFCTECGAKLTPPKKTVAEKCGSCGAKYQGAEKFCSDCGAPRGPRKSESKPDVQKMFDQGFELMKKKQWAESEEIWTKIIEIDPKQGGAWNNRAICRREQGKAEEALADSNEAIRVMPQEGRSYWVRGTIYRLLQQNEKALADLRRAIELDPKLEEHIRPMIEEIESES